MKMSTFCETLEFLFFSLPEILGQSNIQVSNHYLYSDFLFSQCSGGLLDLHMGALKDRYCLTCKKNWKQCPGHFGYIKLYLPVYNIGFLKAVYGILQIICKGCSRVLIEEGEEKERMLKYLRKMRKQGESSRIKGMIRIFEKCRNCTFCPYCESKNGVVRKIGVCNFVQELDTPSNREKKKYLMEPLGKYQNLSNENILDPLKVFRIFQKISFKDLEFLDMDQTQVRPENLLLSFLPIPPPVVRPSVLIGEKISNEDDLTIKLCEIQQLNYRLKKTVSKGSEMNTFKENWNILQIECARYFNSEIFPQEPDTKTVKGLFQRLKGKHGRFRGTLSGKRVDFSGRTVVSPDPNLGINKVGLPFYMATRLTFPERVTNFNKERLRRCLVRGVNRYPGANFLITSEKNKIQLRASPEFSRKIGIKEGFTIERHLKDNDFILFNRQPSLHRISIMAHRVKIVHGKTLRLNECVCKPYNADFDGDEMNIHIPQTQKARAEAAVLMNSITNISTPRNGEPQIASTQDFLSCAFILTSKDRFFSVDKIGKILGLFSFYEIEKKIGFPSIIKPDLLWTGKQLFSLIIFSGMITNFPGKKKKLNSNNIQLNEKIYSLGKEQCSPFMCPYDGWVLFHNANLLAGRIGKSTIGSGNKNSVFSSILNSNSFREATRSMLRVNRLTSFWFSDYGFSIGLFDVSPDKKITDKKTFLFTQGFNLCQAIQYQESKNEKEKEIFEKKIELKLQKILGKIREDLGKICLNINGQTLNSVYAMVLSGSKGSMVNLAQMISCLGQQSVEGKRIKEGLLSRVFPHFTTSFTINKYPPNGFIETGFYEGLNPVNFFFHAIAGREGLIDTAVKTAETGYLQRRLIKSLEDIAVFYDGSVRTSSGRLVQFSFGDDNLDPVNSSFLCRNSNLNYEKRTNINFVVKNFATHGEMETFSRAHLFFDSGFIPFQSAFLPISNPSAPLFIKKGILFFLTIETSLKTDLEKFYSSRIEPGSCVGAIAAQSIGEPGTQMTLQTFHSAGVANLNITLGIPRINEIMNATKVINSPLIRANFFTMGRKKSAFRTKIEIEKVFLGEISKHIEIVIGVSGIFVDIFLDFGFLELLGLSNLSNEICKKIFKLGGIWKKANFSFSQCHGEIRISPPDLINEKNFSSLRILKLVHFCKFDLPRLLVHGLSEPISFIKNSSALQSSFFIKETNLIEILKFSTIDSSTIYCNHIVTNFEIFGIEAARKIIILEIGGSFDLYGISTDFRHISLLADIMTHQGIILGINRHGLGKLKDNTLVLASFEQTLDNLFSSASKGSRDEVLGVSENIILGKELPIGTGLVTLRKKH